MDIKIIKISKIIIIANNLEIIDDECNKFIVEIVNGSIKCKIYNSNKERLSLEKLEEENIIKIYSIKNIINKIIILNNFILSSESSSELNIA